MPILGVPCRECPVVGAPVGVLLRVPFGCALVGDALLEVPVLGCPCGRHIEGTLVGVICEGALAEGALL